MGLLLPLKARRWQIPGCSEGLLPSLVSGQQVKGQGARPPAPNLPMPMSHMLNAPASGPRLYSSGGQLDSWPLAWVSGVSCHSLFRNVQDNQVLTNFPAWLPPAPQVASGQAPWLLWASTLPPESVGGNAHLWTVSCNLCPELFSAWHLVGL